MSLQHLELFNDVDVIQVGARNMQNFELLKELGHCNKPILLKRGLANTIEELLMSAGIYHCGGNNKIMLCERGIRTFETMTRNTLDISAIPLLKKATHFPVVIDPSHAAGIASLVEPLSLAAVACGADALSIEVHNDPKNALSDGAQSLTPDQFDSTMAKIKAQADFQAKKCNFLIRWDIDAKIQVNASSRYDIFIGSELLKTAENKFVQSLLLTGLSL